MAQIYLERLEFGISFYLLEMSDLGGLGAGVGVGVRFARLCMALCEEQRCHTECHKHDCVTWWRICLILCLSSPFTLCCH